ncbi:GNAT family N-acetyltransferase [Halocalculus aciditolerans]|uniref:N-acetyltransferase n=1 Tax=Halocalculus aciditolerans TaxID=1383812 RepID=A0A830F7F7_9EURY|nr:GNAT family N-acetyltransferase [Halocalculus aciditolerans]GGL46606.1 N-acetyltransferase [Halocalculus aciditolerans]
MALTVRAAAPDDALDVLRVLDAAMLETTAETVERRISEGTVFVAEADERVVGALVAVPRDVGGHVEAVAVRRRRRDQGVGSALVDAAHDRWTPLTAEFDPHVRPFYESLGFEVEANGDRYRGRLD